jgi:hypothetical protein
MYIAVYHYWYISHPKQAFQIITDRLYNAALTHQQGGKQ